MICIQWFFTLGLVLFLSGGVLHARPPRDNDTGVETLRFQIIEYIKGPIPASEYERYKSIGGSDENSDQGSINENNFGSYLNLNRREIQENKALLNVVSPNLKSGFYQDLEFLIETHLDPILKEMNLNDTESIENSLAAAISAMREERDGRSRLYEEFINQNKQDVFLIDEQSPSQGAHFNKRVYFNPLLFIKNVSSQSWQEIKSAVLKTALHELFHYYGYTAGADQNHDILGLIFPNLDFLEMEKLPSSHETISTENIAYDSMSDEAGADRIPYFAFAVEAEWRSTTLENMEENWKWVFNNKDRKMIKKSGAERAAQRALFLCQKRFGVMTGVRNYIFENFKNDAFFSSPKYKNVSIPGACQEASTSNAEDLNLIFPFAKHSYHVTEYRVFKTLFCTQDKTLMKIKPSDRVLCQLKKRT